MTMKRAPEPRLRARHALWGAVLLAGCGGIETVGKAPAFTPVSATDGYAALYAAGLPEMTMAQRPVEGSEMIYCTLDVRGSKKAFTCGFARARRSSQRTAPESSACA